MSQNSIDDLSLVREIRDCIEVEKKLFKLNVLEKTSKLLSFIIGIIISVVLFLVAVAYFSIMLFDLCKSIIGSSLVAVIIMIVLFLLLAFLAVIFSEKLFLNFFVKKVYSILFQQNNKDYENENEQSK
ncbi:MAG: hypothetical protein LBT04_01600 [Prevotellaceae bacterium]|jgi:uncharacterized membrane protein (DUF373 family)|nr:hypothetical protein [Prevotellaceae bacterium]